MPSFQEKCLYTQKLEELIPHKGSQLFSPFDGMGIDLLFNYLLEKKLAISVYGHGVPGYGGKYKGPSYKAAVFDKAEPFELFEGADYNEVVTLAALNALGLLKPKLSRVRPNEWGDPVETYGFTELEDEEQSVRRTGMEL